jgi:hypothetical protein
MKRTTQSIIVFLTILGLTNCKPPSTKLEPGICKETLESVNARMNFILNCANVYTNTAPQMEQKEDIIDECSKHSWNLRVENCDRPTLTVRLSNGDFIDCAGILDTDYMPTCNEAYKSYKEKGLEVY